MSADSSATNVDVAIVGGGLAGLTLALQLRQQRPELSIVVLEREHFPAPAAAHKVGEATVEIGAHYLSHTLALEELLEQTQLRKFGLRLFFGSGHHDDLAKADELGASKPLPAISYQLDRGQLETSLAELLRQRDVDIRDGCNVKSLRFGQGEHTVSGVSSNGSFDLRCRWLVDAASRASLIRRARKLAKPSAHRLSAAWLRLDQAVSVDDWSQDSLWQQRCNGLSRRPSTNHLMGAGYWAWIIPLVDGRTSIGLVTDPALHSLDDYRDIDRLTEWMLRQQPQLGMCIADARPSLMDFRILKNLARDAEKTWSADGWAMSGEAAMFADPFYSPGTDFIALGNTFITDLITREQSAPELALRASIYEKMYQSFFASTLSLYEGLYGGFGDTRLMVIKSTWDYAYYWGVLAWLYFREVLTDLDFLRSLQGELKRLRDLNESMQSVFRKHAAERRVDRGHGRFFDQIEIPLLATLNAELLQPGPSRHSEFAENGRRLDTVAAELLQLLETGKPGAIDSSLLGDLARRLDGPPGRVNAAGAPR